MNQNYIKKILILLLILILPKNANALTFSVNKSADNLKPGSDVTITINAEVEADANLTSFNLGLVYDNSLLTYESGSGENNIGIENNNGKIIMAYTGDAINSNFTVATLNFKVGNVNENKNCSLSLSATNVVANTSYKANSTNIALLSLGNDPTLKSLKIPNATLKPAFNKNTTEYSTEVKDVTEVAVEAVATDSSSKIQISDNYKNLQKGQNDIKIVVTAENGTSKTYNISVTLNLTPTNEELLKADSTLKSVDIKNQKLDFKSDEKKYFLEVDNTVTKLEINAIPTNPNAKVEVGSTKLKIGKNNISIKVTSEDESSTTNYDFVVTRAQQSKKIKKTCPDTTSSKEWFIYSLSLFIMFSIGLVLGYLLKKFEVFKKLKRNKKKEEKIEEQKKEKTTEKEEEKLSDTIEMDPKKIIEAANSKNKKN